MGEQSHKSIEKGSLLLLIQRVHVPFYVLYTRNGFILLATSLDPEYDHPGQRVVRPTLRGGQVS